MKKVKVSEATGPVLDWMVSRITNPEWDAHAAVCYVTLPDEDDRCAPSANWSQGGPIIERERIMLIPEPNGRLWTGCIGDTDAGGKAVYAHAPLIAAMRCYAASKLGDEVEVPAELV